MTVSETTDFLMADLLAVVHFCFLAFIVGGQVLILIGWLAGWSWVRNFWFRGLHLGCIAFVAAEGLCGMQCPLTVWETAYRGGNLFNVSGSGWIGTACHWLIYFRGVSIDWLQRGHIAFALLVLTTFVFAPPRLPRLGPRSGSLPPTSQPTHKGTAHQTAVQTAVQGSITQSPMSR
jgi:hypothetical protein